MCELTDSSLETFDLEGWQFGAPEVGELNVFYALTKEDFDSFVPVKKIVLCWEWRLTMDHILYLTKDAHLEVTLFARQRERWIWRTGTLAKLFQVLQLRFLHSSDRGKFTMIYRSRHRGQPCESTFDVVRPPTVLVPEPVIRTVGVFLIATGPTPHDVQARAGQLETVQTTYSDGQVKWAICSRPSSSYELNVPLHIRAMWLRQIFAPTAAQRLKDSRYYEMAMNEYSMWSYPIHAAQMGHICEGIPTDSTVVAPGDGIGVAARVWKGPLVAGDRVTTSLTHTSVVEEDLWETVSRGAQAKNPVFVMSYISTFFSERLVQFVETTTSPVILLENKSSCTLRGFMQYGPGLFVRNVPISWKFRNLHLERTQKVNPILYSENLLRLGTMAFYSENDYVKYVRSMRPFAPECPLFVRYDLSCERIIVPYSEDVPIVCATIQELMIAHDEHPYGRFYFGPIGCDPKLPVEVKGFELSHSLQRRKIYYVSADNEYAAAVVRSLSTEQGIVNGRHVIFFWFPLEEDRDFVLDFGTPQARGQIILSFSRESLPIVPLVTVLYPFVFLRVPGRTYQVQVDPAVETMKNRVLSVLSQLPPHEFVVSIVGKTLGVTCDPWWNEFFKQSGDYVLKDKESIEGQITDVERSQREQRWRAFLAKNEDVEEVRDTSTPARFNETNNYEDEFTEFDGPIIPVPRSTAEVTLRDEDPSSSSSSSGGGEDVSSTLPMTVVPVRMEWEDS